MNLFDPGRPLIAYRPAYVDPEGRHVAPLPQLNLEAVSENLWHVNVMLKRPSSGFSWRTSAPLTLEALRDFLLSWIEDPEETLRLYFDYVPGGPQASATLSLDDLGL